MLLVIIAFISLLLLVITHELGHFLVAKKFGIKVEEFGIGYPPRIWGKKIGETIYSLNWIPFGAFVRIYGHEERIYNDKRSFSSKPIWQRALVILGGVISFWIIAIILLSIVMALGVPSVISDNDTGFKDAKVQIIAVSAGSPAEKAGLKIGDIIAKVKNSEEIDINKVKELQDFIVLNKGKEITLTVKRGSESFDLKAVPRLSDSKNEGALGVGLLRTALISYPWYEAPLKGIEATWNLTVLVLDGWKTALTSIFSGKGVPQGMEVRGVVGIFDLFVQAGGLGASYFLQFIAIIAVSIALFNVLPIPALDGGWFLLLVIESIRKKPLSEKVEKGINACFFFLLLALMVLVTIKDIIRFF